MNVYVGTSGELKNAYIGSTYWDYTPTSNTLAYYPFKENLNDYSGNGKNLSGSATYSNNKMTNSSTITGSVVIGSRGAFTISMWTIGGTAGRINESDSGGALWQCSAYGTNSDNYNGNAKINGSWKRAGTTGQIGTSSDFFLLTFVYNGSTFKMYNNGVEQGTSSSASGNITSGANSFKIGAGTRGQVIIDKTAWSVADIQAYYNNSKSNYSM